MARLLTARSGGLPGGTENPGPGAGSIRASNWSVVGAAVTAAASGSAASAGRVRHGVAGRAVLAVRAGAVMMKQRAIRACHDSLFRVALDRSVHGTQALVAGALGDKLGDSSRNRRGRPDGFLL